MVPLILVTEKPLQAVQHEEAGLTVEAVPERRTAKAQLGQSASATTHDSHSLDHQADNRHTG